MSRLFTGVVACSLLGAANLHRKHSSGFASAAAYCDAAARRNIKVTDTIDHTVLKPTSVRKDVTKVCDEAKQYSFAAVCVPPNLVKHAVSQLKDSPVQVATVIGFPFGYSSINAKVAEAWDAMRDGADELDMVANISAIKEDDWATIEREVKAIKEAMQKHGGDKKLKVIIESGILTDAEIIACCKIYGDAGIDYLKTSTGYAERGASLEAVQLFRQHLPASVKIKASGGIRTLASAQQMIDAGADRIGCSAGVAIAKELSSGTTANAATGGSGSGGY